MSLTSTNKSPSRSEILYPPPNILTELSTVLTSEISFIEFDNKKYDKTLEHLAGVNTFNYLIKNHCKILYLKTYYEVGFSALDSFAHYIKENRAFTTVRREALKKNYNIFSKLYKIKSSPKKYSHADLKLLRNEISRANIYYYDWYIEKINELEKILNK